MQNFPGRTETTTLDGAPVEIGLMVTRVNDGRVMVAEFADDNRTRIAAYGSAFRQIGNVPMRLLEAPADTSRTFRANRSKITLDSDLFLETK